MMSVFFFVVWNNLISLSHFHQCKASITPDEFCDGTIHQKEVWWDNLKRFWMLKNKPHWCSDPNFHIKDCTKLHCTHCNVGFIKYKRLVGDGKIVVMKNGFQHCSKDCNGMNGQLWHEATINVSGLLYPMVICFCAIHRTGVEESPLPSTMLSFSKKEKVSVYVDLGMEWSSKSHNFFVWNKRKNHR